MILMQVKVWEPLALENFGEGTQLKNARSLDSQKLGEYVYHSWRGEVGNTPGSSLGEVGKTSPQAIPSILNLEYWGQFE